MAQRIKTFIGRTEEMAQQLRALAVLPEELGSILNTYMAANKCL